MALNLAGILGRFSGSIGDIIGGSWRGIAYMKMASPQNDPATKAQQATREAFSLSGIWARKFSELWCKTFINKLFRKLTGYNFLLGENVWNFEGIATANDIPESEEIGSHLAITDSFSLAKDQLWLFRLFDIRVGKGELGLFVEGELPPNRTDIKPSDYIFMIVHRLDGTAEPIIHAAQFDGVHSTSDVLTAGIDQFGTYFFVPPDWHKGDYEDLIVDKAGNYCVSFLLARFNDPRKITGLVKFSNTFSFIFKGENEVWIDTIADLFYELFILNWIAPFADFAAPDGDALEYLITTYNNWFIPYLTLADLPESTNDSSGFIPINTPAIAATTFPVGNDTFFEMSSYANGLLTTFRQNAIGNGITLDDYIFFVMVKLASHMQAIVEYGSGGYFNFGLTFLQVGERDGKLEANLSDWWYAGVHNEFFLELNGKYFMAFLVGRPQTPNQPTQGMNFSKTTAVIIDASKLQDPPRKMEALFNKIIATAFWQNILRLPSPILDSARWLFNRNFLELEPYTNYNLIPITPSVGDYLIFDTRIKLSKDTANFPEVNYIDFYNWSEDYMFIFQTNRFYGNGDPSYAARIQPNDRIYIIMGRLDGTGNVIVAYSNMNGDSNTHENHILSYYNASNSPSGVTVEVFFGIGYGWASGGMININTTPNAKFLVQIFFAPRIDNNYTNQRLIHSVIIDGNNTPVINGLTQWLATMEYAVVRRFLYERVGVNQGIAIITANQTANLANYTALNQLPISNLNNGELIPWDALHVGTAINPMPSGWSRNIFRYDTGCLFWMQKGSVDYNAGTDPAFFVVIAGLPGAGTPSATYITLWGRPHSNQKSHAWLSLEGVGQNVRFVVPANWRRQGDLSAVMASSTKISFTMGVAALAYGASINEASGTFSFGTFILDRNQIPA